MNKERNQLATWIGRILCLLGFHDFRLVEVEESFSLGGQVKKVECRRCGYYTTQQG